MAVYTGLLQKLDPTDDELAQVMGHAPLRSRVDDELVTLER